VLKCDATHKRILLEVKNHLTADQELEILLPKSTIKIEADAMTDLDGNKVKEAHSGNRIYLPLEAEAPQGTLVRKIIGQTE
jgi:hypothetical protein